MLKTTIIGASGRMGKELIRLITKDPNFDLVGAVEIEGHSVLGADAGVNAGVSAARILITDDLERVTDKTDVIIDFSSPQSTLRNVDIAVRDNCGIVIGTTGLSNQERSLIKDLTVRGGRILLAPNMSIGINLLFQLCQRTALAVGDAYDVEIVEMHHKYKKDAPSGTAVKLGEIIASAKGLDYASATQHGRQGMVGERPITEIGMHSIRGGDVVGDHQVIFAGDGERIELTHRASSRITFAKGALRAAKFIASAKPGLYDMMHVLGFNETPQSDS